MIDTHGHVLRGDIRWIRKQHNGLEKYKKQQYSIKINQNTTTVVTN